MNIQCFLAAASSLLLAAVNLQANDLLVSGVPHDAPIAIRATATAADLIVDIQLESEWHV